MTNGTAGQKGCQTNEATKLQWASTDEDSSQLSEETVEKRGGQANKTTR